MPRVCFQHWCPHWAAQLDVLGHDTVPFSALDDFGLEPSSWLSVATNSLNYLFSRVLHIVYFSTYAFFWRSLRSNGLENKTAFLPPPPTPRQLASSEDKKSQGSKHSVLLNKRHSFVLLCREWIWCCWCSSTQSSVLAAGFQGIEGSIKAAFHQSISALTWELTISDSLHQMYRVILGRLIFTSIFSYLKEHSEKMCFEAGGGGKPGRSVMCHRVS